MENKKFSEVRPADEIRSEALAELKSSTDIPAALFVQPYVLGFLFDLTGNRVLLRKKQKPDWMVNKFNGVGGKVDDGEIGIEAMHRECDAETGHDPGDWQFFCALSGKGFLMECYLAYYENLHHIDSYYSDTDHTGDEPRVETNHIFPVHDLPPNLVPNCRWLIPMALSLSRGEKCSNFKVEEGSNVRI